MDALLSTISLDQLDDVTGGATVRTANTSSSNQITTLLQTIQSSLSDLGKTNQGLFGNNSTTLLMFAALAMQRRNAVVVYPRGYAYQSWY